MPPGRRRHRPLLLGDDRARTTRWTVVAAGLFVLVLAIFVSGAYRAVYDAVPGRVVGGVSGAAFVGLAAWQFYRNRGVAVSLLLCVAPVTALFLLVVAEGQTSDPTLLEIALLGSGWGLFFGLPLGGVGTLLGAGLRAVVASGVAR